jgi:hypothetical protein
MFFLRFIKAMFFIKVSRCGGIDGSIHQCDLSPD